jgi:hypothetical protein
MRMKRKPEKEREKVGGVAGEGTGLREGQIVLYSKTPHSAFLGWDLLVPIVFQLEVLEDPLPTPILPTCAVLVLGELSQVFWGCWLGLCGGTL